MNIRPSRAISFLYITSVLICFDSQINAQLPGKTPFGLKSYTDPEYPDAMIGNRELTLNLDRATSAGTVDRAILHYSSRKGDLVRNGGWNDGFAIGRKSIEGTKSFITGDGLPAAGLTKLSAILPWESPTPREVEAPKPRDEYEPGTTVYYVWEIIRKATLGDKETTFRTDLKSFTMPRRITLAIMGDSFGSGEGAPDKNGPTPWIDVLEGEIAHRSPISGQELAVKEFFEDKPGFAYDYINVSCSGAVLSSIEDELSDYMKEDGIDGFIQSEKVSEWLSARQYKDLDTIILSISGNDFGFAKLVEGYLGISPQRKEDFKDWVKQYIICKIIDVAYRASHTAAAVAAGKACIWAGFTGPVGYAVCYAAAYATAYVIIEETIGEARVNCWNLEDEILERFWGPFTFHRKYGDVDGEGTAKNWNYYENFVAVEHQNMARKISSRLAYTGEDSPKSQLYVRPSQVIQTGYPTFFKGTNSYTESIGSIEALKLLFDGDDFTINVDRKINLPWPYPDVPIKFNADLNSILHQMDFSLDGLLSATKIGNFDSTEINEVNNELAPPYIRNGELLDRPEPGGINHCIRQAVVAADNRFSSTDWCYVELDSFVPNNGHLGSSNRHFNRLSDAPYQEGPHLLSNAFHPNARGHRNIYRAAILEELEKKLTLDYFKEAAGKDGLGDLTMELADFAFDDDSLPGLTYNPNQGSLSINGSVINRGSIKPNRGVSINPKIFVDPKLKLEEEIVITPTKPVPSISPLDPGKLQNFDVGYKISNVPLRDSLPFQIVDKNDNRPPFTVAPIFQNRQKILRYFFSKLDANFTLEIRGDQTLQELNSPNNIVSRPIRIYPDLEKNGLSQAFATVRKDLIGIIGKEVQTVDYAMLVKNKNIRNYFGFYSPELDSKDMTIEQAIASSQSDAFMRIHRSLVGEDPESPQLYGKSGDLIPLYLFNSEESPFYADVNTPVRGPRGRVRKLASVVKDAPRDGRSVTVGLPINNINFSGLNLKNEIVFTAKRPVANRGIVIPRDGQILNSKDQIFQLGGASLGDLHFLRIGSQIDGKDFINDFPITNYAKSSMPIRELPRDGRTIYATLSILSQEGLRKERYKYFTERRNATLLSPLPNDCLGGQNQIISWSQPDLKVGSSVEAYRLAIGTNRGYGDIIPGPAGLSKADNDKLSGFGYITINAGSNPFLKRSIVLPKNYEIPQDGRVLHVTLGTLRDGEWEYEHFERGCRDTNSAGLVAPKIELPVSSSFITKVATGSSFLEKNYRIRFGTGPNQADLFDSGILSKEVAMNGVQVLMPQLNPVLDDQGRPVPIWATVSALSSAVRPIEISKQSYALVPEINATLFSPLINNRIDAGTKVRFQWNSGLDAVGYKLTANTDLDGKLKKVYEVELGKDELEATLDFKNFQSRHLVIVLETIRDATSQIPSSSKGYRYRFDTPDLKFYEKDAIPDYWQFQEFGRSNDDGLAEADPDRDGANNLMEYLSDTDPNNPNDRFSPTVKFSKRGNDLVIVAMIVNKPIYTTSYQLQSSNDLQTWIDEGKANNPAPGDSEMVFRMDSRQEGKKFYRIILKERTDR